MNVREFVLVQTTCDKREVLDQIALCLVTGRLAACVQIMGPLQSTYEWQGRLERTEEWQLSAKTRKGLFSLVEAEIRRLHSYQVPGIVGLEIVASCHDYRQWMDQQLVSQYPAGDRSGESQTCRPIE